MPASNKTFALIGPDGKPYPSPWPGTFGGHRGGKLYGRLDCRAALQAIARGDYMKHRVFFADEPTAIAAGYRPCAVCMPQEYAAWKKTQPVKSPTCPKGGTLMSALPSTSAGSVMGNRRGRHRKHAKRITLLQDGAFIVEV